MADGGSPLFATIRFLLFAALAVGGPGLALQKLATRRYDPGLVLPVGLLFCSGSYWLSLVAGRPWLFPALVAAAHLPLLAGGLKGRADGPSLRGALPAFLTILGLLALTQFRTNRMGPGGAFLVDTDESVDSAVHVGLTWELVAGWPPQVPGLAGVPLHYHVGSHLVRAAATRWAGIHPYDSLNRFDPALWGLGLVLALRAAAFSLGFGKTAVALAGFLPLAADLCFLPGLLLGSENWAFKLGGNFGQAVFFASSMSPAMAAALGALVALERARRGEGHGFLAVGGFLAAGVVYFKVFTGAQLLLALGLVFVRGRERRELLAIAAPAAIALAAIGLWAIGPGTGVEVDFVPFAPANPARLMLGLAEVSGLPLVASGLAWLVLSLGLRAFGFPGAWRSLREGEGPRAALGALALSGWPIAFFVTISADPSYDESFHLTQASGLLLWLFAVRWLEGRGPLVAVASALLCLPGTAEFIVRKATRVPATLPPATVRAMSALREASCPGDVVLTRPGVELVPPVVVLAGRRVPLARFTPYWQQFTTPEFMRERDTLVRSFYRARDADEAAGLAARLGARFVLYEGGLRPAAPAEKSASLRDVIDELEARGGLTPIVVEPRLRLYRIGPPEGRCR
jgi:hypothetical protein